jgi:hypothetical protein
MQSVFLAKPNVSARENLSNRILLVALIALFLCPLSAFAQCATSWQGGGAGVWSAAANWSAGVPSNNNTCISTASSAVTLDINGTTANLTLSLATDTLNIGNGLDLTVSGATISNAGKINMNSSGGATELVIAGSTTLSGGGTLTMSNNAKNMILGGGTFTNQETIQGAGVIGNNNLTLVNSGTIDVNVVGTLQINPNGGTTNTGTLEASHDGTLILAGTFTNTGGTIWANTVGATVELNGVTINGGTLKGSGIIESIANSTLNGVSNSSNYMITQSGATTISGTITNTGTITLASAGSNTFLYVSGNTTLKGNGKVVLGKGGPNIIEGASTGQEILTNSSTIEGTGNIGNGFMGLVNTGSIIADDSTPLIIQASTAGFTDNSGSLEGKLIVDANDTLTIMGTFTNFSGTTLTGGTYMVTGTLGFDGANIVTNAGNITLTGKNSQIIDNQGGGSALANFATNALRGTFTLAGNRNFTTLGAFTDQGTISISAGSTFAVGGGGNYKQMEGMTVVNGTLSVPTMGIVDVIGGPMLGIGTVAGNVTLAGSGTMSPGAAGKKAGELTINGTYTQTKGTVAIDLGGTTAGTQYDVLNITGTAALGGTLTVDLISGFTPTVGNSFDIIDYSSETGTFSNMTLPTVTGDHWTVAYDAKDVVLTLVAGAGPTVFLNAPAAAPGPVASSSFGATPARWTRSLRTAPIAEASMRSPSAILTPAETCGGFRGFVSFSCGARAISSLATRMGPGMHVTQRQETAINQRHNNVAVASTSGPTARSGATLAPDARMVSAASLARVYICAYLPSEVASTTGCR